MNINPLSNLTGPSPPSSATAPVDSPSAQSAAASSQIATQPPATAVTVAQDAEAIVSNLQALAGSVEFSVDKVAGMQVITIRDPKSGDVIRQLPSEEALKVARQLATGQGGLINRSA